MKKLLPIIVIVAILAFVGYSFISKKDTTTDIQEIEYNSGKKTTEQNNQTPIQTEGKYVDYTPTIVQESAVQGKKVVLFFHASWCPTCISANKDILGRIDEIPENIIVVKTDYDNEKELKKKYNVTYQHTYVQVDGNGELITAWNGGDLDEILRNVK